MAKNGDFVDSKITSLAGLIFWSDNFITVWLLWHFGRRAPTPSLRARTLWCSFFCVNQRGNTPRDLATNFSRGVFDKMWQRATHSQIDRMGSVISESDAPKNMKQIASSYQPKKGFRLDSKMPCFQGQSRCFFPASGQILPSTSLLQIGLRSTKKVIFALNLQSENATLHPI